MRAIEQQEAVIFKLEKLLEQSVESQIKVTGYRDTIKDLDADITKLKSEVDLVYQDGHGKNSAGQPNSIQREIEKTKSGN